MSDSEIEAYFAPEPAAAAGSAPPSEVIAQSPLVRPASTRCALHVSRKLLKRVAQQAAWF